MTSNTSSSASNGSPVPALIARRITVLAPPSLSTVNHLDGVTASSSSSSTTSVSRPSTTAPVAARRHRPDLAQAVSQPTAAVPISTHENISTSKSWSSQHMLKPTYQRKPFGDSVRVDAEGFAVHPTFRSDAEWRGDVLVRVEGVEFWVHKDVLLFSSPFFQSVLAGGWSESRLSRLMVEERAAGNDRGGEAEEQACRNSERDEGADNEAGASSASDRETSREGALSQPVVVPSVVDENSPTKLEADPLTSNDLDPEHLGGENRRRSLPVLRTIPRSGVKTTTQGLLPPSRTVLPLLRILRRSRFLRMKRNALAAQRIKVVKARMRTLRTRMMQSSWRLQMPKRKRWRA